MLPQGQIAKDWGVGAVISRKRCAGEQHRLHLHDPKSKQLGNEAFVPELKDNGPEAWQVSREIGGGAAKPKEEQKGLHRDDTRI